MWPGYADFLQSAYSLPTARRQAKRSDPTAKTVHESRASSNGRETHPVSKFHDEKPQNLLWISVVWHPINTITLPHNHPWKQGQMPIRCSSHDYPSQSGWKQNEGSQHPRALSIKIWNDFWQWMLVSRLMSTILTSIMHLIAWRTTPEWYLPNGPLPCQESGINVL